MSHLGDFQTADTPRMNVYEVEVENAAQGYRLLHHLRATSISDAIARASDHWRRPIVCVTFRRVCKPWEVADQLARDRMPHPDPSDVRIVASFGG